MLFNQGKKIQLPQTLVVGRTQDANLIIHVPYLS
jgi:hypothetical protein